MQDTNANRQNTRDKRHKRKGLLGKIRTYLRRNKLGELLVTSGLISSKQLLSALRVQKHTNQPLGQVILQNYSVSRLQLSYVLGRQVALRGVVALVLFMASWGGISSKRANAGGIKDVPAEVSLVSSTNFGQYPELTQHPRILGTKEKVDSNIKPFTKWSDMFARFEREMARSSSQETIDNWHKDLSAYKGLNIKTMATKVNQMMNKKRYILDQRNWGRSDYWATPVEFMARGGDCEDFAIAKYSALRALGVPESRLRLAIVQDTVKNIPHAVLVVYTEKGPYILDNQIKTLIDASSKGRYRPIYSINRSAWWLHTETHAQLASAR